MKISEVIACLQRRLIKHGDVEVLVTWEGTMNHLNPRDFYLSKQHNTPRLPAAYSGRLLINCEANDDIYKEEFAADPTEGEDGL